MSDKLPIISGRELVKVLAKIGFTPARQNGSHVFLKHNDGRRTVVPMHQEINKSTLIDILSQTKLTKEEFLNLL